MSLKIYQVDAFASKVFEGNPAAVIFFETWPDDALMQQIAMENNLSETAFAVEKADHYEIRWFTPEVEVDLCGHATLATAHVIFNHLDYHADLLRLHSPRSGALSVIRSGNILTIDFPADIPEEAELPEFILDAVGKEPVSILRGRSDYLLVYAAQDDVEALQPDHDRLARTGARGIIATATGTKVDFVSRFFAPGVGINEDPVTGSAHTTLTPYWSKVLGKKKLLARQISSRGGELICEYLGERVQISGQAVTYLVGEIHL